MQAAEAITEAERAAATPPPPEEPEPTEPLAAPPVRSGPSLDGAGDMSLKDLLRDHELEVGTATGATA